MADLNITTWLTDFKNALQAEFGKRIRFFGLQGSRGRGEASNTSDIDVVVILDRVEFEDLQTYRDLLDQAEHRELICGFVAGESEVSGWEPGDLLGLILDTTPIVGTLEPFRARIQPEDCARAVLSGACNLYHACSHNFLHGQRMSTLAGLYKSARFTVRLKHYAESGEYVARFADLKETVSVADRRILEVCDRLADPSDHADLADYSRLLLDWCRKIIC